MNIRAYAALCFTLMSAGTLRADDSFLGSFWSRCTRVSECPSLGGTCDDYCRKHCPPLIPVSRCGGPDDYCRKSAPCLTDVSRCGGVDDYCRKCIPCLLCPPSSPHLLYAPPEPCCAPGRRR